MSDSEHPPRTTSPTTGSTATLDALLRQCPAWTNASFDVKGRPEIYTDLRAAWDRAVGLLLRSSDGDEDDDDGRQVTTTTTTTDEWFRHLWNLHGEATRYYHTAVHLWELISYWNVLQQQRQQQQQQQQQQASRLPDDDSELAIVFAIFFHDAIYDPTSSGTNEVESAALWRTFCHEIPAVSTALTEQVAEFILATQHHVVSPEHAPALALFLDLDLAVLAKERVAYRAYAAAIRREYAVVPHAVYCATRADILEGLLSSCGDDVQDKANDDTPTTAIAATGSSTKLYGSPILGACFEEQARQNLRYEVDLLRQGQIPN
jgi:predicted metal-dependent HD superfamily phosphohydrolase